MKKIRKGDLVILIAGKCKHQKGIVLGFKGEDRLLVKGVAITSKAVRQNPSKNIRGGFRKQESSVHISNVALWDEESSRPSKVGIRMGEKGKRERYYKTSGQVVSAI